MLPIAEINKSKNKNQIKKTASTNGAAITRLFVSFASRFAKLMGKLGLLGYVGSIYAFFLFTVVLYSLLSFQQNQQEELFQLRQQHQLHLNGTDNIDAQPRISVTIFAAPTPFSSGTPPNSVDARQDMAVRSWLALSPDVSVVLFSQHSSISKFAERLGPRVTVESSIDFTFWGAPLYNSMVARSQASVSGISLLIHPEIILLPDILNILHYAQTLDNDWLVIAMPRHVQNFPFQLVDGDDKHWRSIDNGKTVRTEKLQKFLLQKKTWRTCGERLVMAWNNGASPLLAGTLPPFVYGEGLHNEWLINEILSSDLRYVFDVSQVVSTFYPESFVDRATYFSGDDDDSRTGKTQNLTANYHLAVSYGSHPFEKNQAPSSPIKLVKCRGKYYFVNQLNNSIYSMQGLDGRAASYRVEPPTPEGDKEKLSLLKALLHSWRVKKWKACVEDINSLDAEYQCSVMHLYKVSTEVLEPPSLPFSLESLLQTVADKNRSVVLAVVGDNYRDMLMSWACRLRQLAIKNFIIGALDSEVYEFSVMQGLPVFKVPTFPGNISFNGCHFGTDCFKRVTKVKSRVVLRILKLGYNVLMSDVDVFWFYDPLPFLYALGCTGKLLAQSDEYNQTGPINLPRRLNSGFYFARSDPATISAMEMVVEHAKTSGLSEQPSFYDVLCGEGGVNRVGDDLCREPRTNLTVVFLDRDAFPNGAYKDLWQESKVRSACAKLGCFILHNNWINGRTNKLERQTTSGLWEYDSSSRMCLHSWHSRKSYF